MLGNSSMELTTKVMCEAIEYWLTNKVLNKDEPSPVVNDVTQNGSPGKTFTVSLKEKEE